MIYYIRSAKKIESIWNNHKPDYYWVYQTAPGRYLAGREEENTKTEFTFEEALKTVIGFQEPDRWCIVDKTYKPVYWGGL